MVYLVSVCVLFVFGGRPWLVLAVEPPIDEVPVILIIDRRCGRCALGSCRNSAAGLSRGPVDQFRSLVMFTPDGYGETMSSVSTADLVWK